MRKFSGYLAIIAFLFFLSLAFYSIDEIFIQRTLADIKTFEIEKGESAKSVIKGLAAEGIVRNQFVAGGYLVIAGIEKSIKPGVYSIGPVYSVKEVFDELVKGAGHEVRIQEGLTIKEITQILKEKGSINNAIEFERLVSNFNNSDSRYVFLPKESRVNLEGYLFPDTYSFAKSSAEEIIETFLDNFEKKVYSQFKNISAEYLNEVIIVASMLEKEVRAEKDMKLVSGILWKRIKAGIPLQVDATLVYIKCFVLNRSDCRLLASSDKELRSPYNTYLHQGLPPSPISNPGLMAINAALNPEISPYFYYLSAKDDGRTIFSVTLEEHNLNRAIYR